MAAFEQRKGGYDCEFVSPPPKSLECPVCLLILRDPHVISCCGNEFCQVCIERVQRDGKPCPLCNELKFTTFLHKKLVREVNALVVRCPQKEQGCEWEGELGQLQSHLINPGAEATTSKGCGFVMVECSYQCGAHLQRRLLQEHEMDFCPKRPIEMQIANLMRKFETITVENLQLRQELEKVQEVHKKALKVNKEELDQMKQELSEVKKKNDHLQKANEDMQKMCDKLKKGQNAVRADIDEQKNVLEKKCALLQTHTMPLPVPPYYFSMPNFNQYPLSDYDPVYLSEPFYSHPGGYKMVAGVYPNGFGRYKGTHMGIYLGIFRGEFDDQLHWPFDGSITVQVYNNTTGQWCNEQTIVINEKECGLKIVMRPVDALAYGSWGYSDFLSLTELKNNYMTQKNVVNFRITKVEICNCN